MLPLVLIAIGAYLGAGIYHAGQRLGRDSAHPDRLRWTERRRILAGVLTWLPSSLVASGRYARSGWRPAMAYFLADAGAPFGLFAGVLVIAAFSR